MVQGLELVLVPVLVLGPVQAQVQLHPPPVQVLDLVRVLKQVHMLGLMQDHEQGQDLVEIRDRDQVGAMALALVLDMGRDQAEGVAQAKEKGMVKAMVKGMGAVTVATKERM